MGDERGESRRERNARFAIETPEVELPEQAAHVWEWFWVLSGRRRSGPEALNFTEISAWRQLTGELLLLAEVDMLMAMDDAYLRAVREDQAAARDRALDSRSTGRK